jgi:ketosteroid isomerase-like protein
MEPKAFADDWVDSWNSHDLDRILAHYDSEIVFLSPIALQTVGNGRVAGIACAAELLVQRIGCSPGPEI